MWGGVQPGLPSVQDSEEKKASTSIMEVCDLASGRWEQKPTTGTPPLGVYGYAATVILEGKYSSLVDTAVILVVTIIVYLVSMLQGRI